MRFRRPPRVIDGFAAAPRKRFQIVPNRVGDRVGTAAGFVALLAPQLGTPLERLLGFSRYRAAVRQRGLGAQPDLGRLRDERRVLGLLRNLTSTTGVRHG
jgi:hypothetical protein